MSGKGKAGAVGLEEQEDIEKKEQKAKSGTTKTYGRKKGDKLGGETLGNYSKRTIDDTFPKTIQSLIEKQRTAREILETQNAGRYDELPQLYSDIRTLEQRRDKMIFQMEHPVDDNPDTGYVIGKYKQYIAGQKPHFSVAGKKEKFPFSSGGEDFTSREIQFAVTQKSSVSNLNKNGLETKRQTRDRFANALTIPDDMEGAKEEAKPLTKKEEEKRKETTPAQREKERETRKAEIENEGYEAFKKSTFNDKGVVVSYSQEYVAFHTKYKSTAQQKKDADKKYQKQYLKENPPPPPPKLERAPSLERTPSAGGEGGGGTPPADERKGGSTKDPASRRRSSGGNVGRPGEGSTRAGFIGESLYTGKADVIENILGGLDGEQTKKRVNEIRVEEKEKGKRDRFDNIVIGTAYNNMADPNWVKENPPGTGPYERNKAVIDYYVSIGVEPPFNYPSPPGASSDEIPASSSGSSRGEGSSSGDAKDEHPTADGVKTEAEADTGRAPPPFTQEQKQEEIDKQFDPIEVKEGDRPGTIPEYDILDASRSAPPGARVPLRPSQITRNMSRDIEKEDKQRGEASIERLKEEIKALHLVYDNNIKEFRENPHKGQKEDALKSKDIKVVRAHHKKMEQRIREYYRSGDADSLNVGVIVPIDTYLQQYLSRSTPVVSNIQTPITGGGTRTTQGAQHRHNHLIKKGNDPFGHSIAQSTYYQRGGINAYRQQPVANHSLRIKGVSKSGPIADPKVYVDAPMNNFLQRPLKQSTSLKIKS